MKKIGRPSQITKYIPMWFDEESGNANAYRDNEGCKVFFNRMTQAEAFVSKQTQKTKAVAKSVEHITIFM